MTEDVRDGDVRDEDVLETDVVVVGAGSAGCVLVRRLLDAGVRVVLLEAGGEDVNPAIHDPARLFELWQGKEDWNVVTVPQAGAAGRRLSLPRGKVLGGSHALNAMINVRGVRQDYDSWSYGGCPGWSWAEVLPYFRRLESFDRGASALHGGDGPVDVVSDYPLSPLHEAVLAAAQQTGVPLNPDYNSGDNTGVSQMQLTLRDGRRLNSWGAYLRDVRDHPLLTVRTDARLRRVVVAGGRATGVEFTDGSGVRRTVRAARQVVLSCGAIGTPVALLRSGIGPADELRGAGLEVVLDSPGVGRNLHDHLLAPVVFSAEREVEAPLVGATHAQTHLFARSRPDLAVCDTQPIHFSLPMPPEGETGPDNGFTLMGGLVRPLSRGSVRLGPQGRGVLVDVAALAEEADVAALEFSVRQVREIGRAPALAAWGAREVHPGPAGDDPAQLRSYVRRSCVTYHHQVGTARMGGDALAVCDPELRVRGVEGLRVVDASVMPSVPTGNTNTPSMMIGEKGADLLLADLGAPAGSAA